MKKIIFGLLLVLLIGPGGIALADSEYSYIFPRIFSDYYPGGTPTPSITPTASPTATNTPKPTQTPTITPTPGPGALWCWAARAGNVGGKTEIWAVIPGYCCELKAQKSGKTIYIRAECPSNPTCEIFPPPDSIPPPFAWGDVERLIYDASSKEVCSIQWPYNCIDTE